MGKGAPLVHLLLGPENGRKQEYVDGLRDSIRTATGEAAEEHRLYPYKLDVLEAVALLRNSSLFSRHKLVMLYDVHEIKKKSDVEQLAEYCAQPSAEATFVLLSDEFKVEKALENAVPKDSRKIFWEMFEHEKRRWIDGYFRKAGFTIAPEAIELLLELVENDTQDLRRECGRLALFFPAGAQIDEDAVERLVYHSKAESIFTLFDAFTSGEPAKALDVLEAIRLSGEMDAVATINGFPWQIKRLLGFRRLRDRQYGTEEAGTKLGIRGKKALQTHVTGAERYAAAELERATVLTARYVALIRSARSDLGWFLLQNYLYELMVKRGTPWAVYETVWPPA